MLDKNQTRLLREGAQQFSLTLSEETVSQFAAFIEEIQRWSKIADLLSHTDPATLIRKHILDSLALLPWIPVGSRVLDLGSGAGFPGLPLAIAGSGIRVSLIEARRKRANFSKRPSANSDCATSAPTKEEQRTCRKKRTSKPSSISSRPVPHGALPYFSLSRARFSAQRGSSWP